MPPCFSWGWQLFYEFIIPKSSSEQASASELSTFMPFYQIYRQPVTKLSTINN
jgi:hypothetical protein